MLLQTILILSIRLIGDLKPIPDLELCLFPFGRAYFCLLAALILRLTACLILRLIACLILRLITFLILRLIACLIACLILRLIACLIACLILRRTGCKCRYGNSAN